MFRFACIIGLTGCGGLAYKWRQVQVATEASKGKSLSLKERFESFASTGGVMSVDDFYRSVSSPDVEDTSASSASIRRLFKTLDADGDNQVSYQEYCAFFSLISVRDELFRIAFTMFDRDGNGHLDINEFSQVMRSLCVDPAISLDVTQSNIATYLFGPKKDRTLTFGSFLDLVHRLRWDLRRAEFEQYDRQHPGKILLADLRKIVFKGDDSRTSPQEKDRDLFVSWNTYRKLFDILLDADRIARAMELYHEAKAPTDTNDDESSGGDASVDRMEFARAIRCGEVKNIAPEEVDLFFRLFDTDGSNSVSSSEFQEICNVRNAFYATAMPKFDEPRRTGVQQFVYCMAQRT